MKPILNTSQGLSRGSNNCVHKSVLVEEVLAFLQPVEGSIVLDATVGCGGHAEEILKRIVPGGRLIGIDCDKKALAIAQQRLSNFKNNLELINANFRNLDEVLNRLGIKKIDSALFDLGVSSLQLDDASRGFSFRSPARLDMRMDDTLKISAYDFVNNTSEYELEGVIRDYGEERYSKRIARAIVSRRKHQPIENATDLAQIIYEVTPKAYRKFKIDPATRTFQGLRIAVNNELAALTQALGRISGYIEVGGRLAVISFNSLEDRIAKRHFREMAKDNIYTILTKKPVTPGESEIEQNPRARSAKLRAVQKNA